MLLRIFTLLLLCNLWAQTSFAQDPSFSQFYSNRIYLNPAFTGLESGISFSGVSRMQWVNVDDGFRTVGVSVEIQEPYLRSGFGISLFQDVQGLAQLTTSYVGLSYAYTIPADRHNIHIGVQAQWVQKGVDWDKITFSDQLDPVYGNIYTTSAIPVLEKVSYTDFNIGAIWRFDSELKLGKRKFRDIRNSIGFSLNHAPYLFNGNGGNESLQNIDTRTSPRLTLHAGSVIPMLFFNGTRSKIYLSPNIKYDMQGENLFNGSQNLQVLTYGLYLMYEGMYVGGFYQNKHAVASLRNTNALILMVGAYINAKSSKQKNNMFIGFSYDANTSGVGPRAGGVFELAFRWTFADAPGLFGIKASGKKKKVLECKNFF